MTEKKADTGLETVADEHLERVAGGFGYPEECYRSYINLLDKRIFYACNRLNVKPYCPKCGEPLKVLVLIQMKDEELIAAHERNHIMCHSCHFEGTDDDWVFSPNNHR